VEHDDAESFLRQSPLRVHQRLRRGTLEERARLAVNRPMNDVVGRCVSDIEVDRGVEARQLDQGRSTEGPLSDRRPARRTAEEAEENDRCGQRACKSESAKVPSERIHTVRIRESSARLGMAMLVVSLAAARGGLAADNAVVVWDDALLQAVRDN